MLRTQANQAVEAFGQGRQAVAHAQRQEVFGVLAAGAGVQGLALQPGAHHPAAVDGEGAEVGQVLVDIADTHGARILPPSMERWQAHWRACRPAGDGVRAPRR
ncbi:hypothetical protein D9M68_576510 [compost metagenome]